MQFIKPVPFTEAVDKLGAKSLIGASLDSEEWSRVPLALRERAFFSSTVESTRFLQRARDSIADFLQAHREEITMPDGTKTTALKTGSRTSFIAQLQEFAHAEGLGPIDPIHEGTIRDVKTEKRLGLIFDTQVRQAQDYGNWKQGMDSDVLNAFPAQRFIRERQVKEPRDNHRFHEGQVELKSNLDFWIALNRDFGVPWGPWGWGCGHDVEDVDRAEAVRIGLLAPHEYVKPVEKDFNDRLEASVANLDPEMVDQLKEAFGDQVQIHGDTVKWTGKPSSRSSGQSVQKVPSVPAAPTGRPTLDGVLKSLGLHKKPIASPADMTALVEELREEQPIDASRVTRGIDAPITGVISQSGLRTDLQAFCNFVPSHKLLALPKVAIAVNRSKRTRGNYNPSTNAVAISVRTVDTAEQRKRTMFHELMHWLHMEGDPEYRAAIKAHFDARTKGESIQRLGAYDSDTVGKKDKWYEVYAGRIYPQETVAQGLEVPTRYIEWLTMTPAKQAELWNNADFRETLLIVLKGLF